MPAQPPNLRPPFQQHSSKPQKGTLPTASSGGTAAAVSGNMTNPGTAQPLNASASHTNSTHVLNSNARRLSSHKVSNICLHDISCHVFGLQRTTAAEKRHANAWQTSTLWLCCTSCCLHSSQLQRTLHCFDACRHGSKAATCLLVCGTRQCDSHKHDSG